MIPGSVTKREELRQRMSRLHSLNSTSEFKKNEQAIAQTSSSLNNQIESLDRKAKASFERIAAEQNTVKHLLNGLSEGMEGLNQRRHTLEKMITEQGNQLEALLHREMEYYAAIQDVQQWISALNEHYLSLENAHGNISQQQAENDQNYQTICRIVNEIEVQLKEHTVKLDQLSEGTQALRKRITQLGECLEKLDSEYANNSQRLERMDAELIGIERHFAQVVENFKEAAAEQAFTQGIFVGIICVAACAFGSWALAGKASATASTGAAVKTGGAFQIATKATLKHAVASAASGMVVRKLGPSNPALAKGLAIVTSICLGGIGESSASDLLKTAAQATAISTASEAVGHSAGPTAGRLMQSVGETLAVGSYTSSASFMKDLGGRAFANEAGHLAAQKAGSRYAPLAGSMVKGIAGGAMNGMEALPDLVKDIFIEALPQAAIVELIKHEHTAHLVADAAKTFAGSYRDHTRVRYVAAGDDPFSSPDDSSDEEEEPLEMQKTKAAEIAPTEPSALTLGEIWNRNKRKEEMLPAQVAASLLQLSSKVIVDAAKKVCGVHSSVQEKCQQTKEFAAWGVNELKTRTPKHWKDEIKGWLYKYEQVKLANIKDEIRLSHIEPEEARRYYDNLDEIAINAAAYVLPGGIAGKKGARHLVKNTKLVKPTAGASAEKALAQVKDLQSAKKLNIAKKVPDNIPESSRALSGSFENKIKDSKNTALLDYSFDFNASKVEFVNPKEFDGTLRRDLTLLRYHSSALDQTYKWFMPVGLGNSLDTIEKVRHATSKIHAFGEITHATVARIPAGEKVRFLHGRAVEKFDPHANLMRTGGGVQYRFYDFNPNWLVETKKLPVDSPASSLRAQLLSIPRLKNPLVSNSDPVGLCFNQINEYLHKVSLSSNYPKKTLSFLVDDNMDKLAKYIPECRLEDFFKNSITNQTLLNTNIMGTVSKIYIENSTYIVLATDVRQKIIGTLMGLNYLKNLNLKHADFAVPLALGYDKAECWLVMTDMGESLFSLMRKKDSNLERYLHQAGLAYGELHAKSAIKLEPGHLKHSEFLNASGFKDSPLTHVSLTLGLTQGDAHLGNITWNMRSGKAAFIDMEYFIFNLSVSRRLLGRKKYDYPIFEYVYFLNDIAEKGKEFGLPQTQVESLMNAFRKGYQAVNSIDDLKLEDIVRKLIETDSSEF